MNIRVGNYELRPYSNFLCWEIWQFRLVKKKFGKERKEWVHTGHYPTTLASGLGGGKGGRQMLDDESLCDRCKNLDTDTVDFLRHVWKLSGLPQFKCIWCKVTNRPEDKRRHSCSGFKDVR